MGIPAYVVASSLVAVLAQRLVRKLCACKTVQTDGSALPKARFVRAGQILSAAEALKSDD